MTEDIAPRDPDTQPIPRVGSGERKRAALVLGVLAVLAVVVAGIMVYALGSSKKSPSTSTAVLPTGPNVAVTGGNQSTSSRASTSPPPSPTTPTTTAPSTTGPVSCPTSAPCALSQDVGNVVGAVNAYRTSHGAKAVTGVVTRAAKKCAVDNGDGPACPAGYFWEPVGRSGAQVVQKIDSGGRGGHGWLLDPKMTKLQVGWAYIPASKSFECVVVSNA